MRGPELLGILAIVLVLVSFGWQSGRSDSMLKQWAGESGFRLINAERRRLLRGPFFFRSNKGQTVYRVTVEDGNGLTRSGWVRCGGWILGLFTYHVDAIWDDQSY